MRRLFNPFDDFVDKETGRTIRTGLNKVAAEDCDRLQTVIDKKMKKDVKEYKEAVEAAPARHDRKSKAEDVKDGGHNK